MAPQTTALTKYNTAGLVTQHVPNITGSLFIIFVLNSSPSRSLISKKLEGGRSGWHQAGKSESQPRPNHFLCLFNLFNQNGIFVLPQHSEFSLRQSARCAAHSILAHSKGYRKAGQELSDLSMDHLQVPYMHWTKNPACSHCHGKPRRESGLVIGISPSYSLPKHHLFLEEINSIDLW